MKCQNSSCIQTIRYVTQYTVATAYSMNILFTQELLNKKIRTAKTSVQVVCKRHQVIQIAPQFSNNSYEYELDDSVQPGSVLRHVRIQVNQSHVDLPVNQTGFTLELLNSKDSSPANDLFEIVPSYGEGLLVSSLKLKQRPDLKRNRGTLDFIVFYSFLHISIR